MSKIEMLRLLIKERLTSAAEEIFEVFGRTIVDYEEELSRSKLEIERQKRLLDMSCKPQIRLEQTVLPEPLEWGPDLGQEDLELPQVKEEEEERRVDEDRDPLHGLEDFRFYPSKPGEAQPGTAAEVTPGLGEPDGETPGMSEPDCSLTLGESSDAQTEAAGCYSCTACGIEFIQRAHWARHMRAHRTGSLKHDKFYKCDICGKKLTRLDGFQKHLRIHTGEKPYCCGVCGKRFSDNSNYKRHVRIHRAEQVHGCNECGKHFSHFAQLMAHVASHHTSVGCGNDT